MHLLISFCLIVCAFADSPGYSFPTPSRHLHHGRGISGGFGGALGGGFTSGGVVATGPCGTGQVRHVDGNCVQPIINRNIFHYLAPKLQVRRGPDAVIPQPKVDYNIVFVRTPERHEGQGPIVMPPPQQKTLVYVLTENQEIAGQQLIKMQSTPQSPEVYYINYDEGDNPTLPGGIDLQTALASAAQGQGQVIEGGSGGISFGSVSTGGISHHSVSFGDGSTGGSSHGGESFESGAVGGGTLSQEYGTP